METLKWVRNVEALYLPDEQVNLVASVLNSISVINAGNMAEGNRDTHTNVWVIIIWRRT